MPIQKSPEPAIWPTSLTLTLNRYGRNVGSAHRLHGVNIWHKFHENPTTYFGDMERTRFWTRQTDRYTSRRGRQPVSDRHDFWTDRWADIHPGQKKYLLYTGGDIIVKSTLINFSCASLLKLKFNIIMVFHTFSVTIQS